MCLCKHCMTTDVTTYEDWPTTVLYCLHCHGSRFEYPEGIPWPMRTSTPNPSTNPSA